MTSIAWDGKKLVSDSQGTAGVQIQPSGFKKIYEPGEGEYWEVMGQRVLAVGVSGDGKAVESVMEKLRTGVNHKTKIEDIDEIAFGALIITEDSTCYRWQMNKRQGRPTHMDLLQLMPPAAVGSGQAYAIGILSIGKSAEVAIRGAIRLDKYSGGELQIWEAPPKPATKSVRPVVAEPTPA
jgi:hypothetical protein